MAEASVPPSVLSEVLRLLGVFERPTEELLSEISSCYAELSLCAAPKAVYKIFDIETTRDALKITGSLVLSGSDLAALCRECKRAALLAATVGAAVDRLVSRTQARSMSRALITDACASAFVEKICDEAEQNIASDVERESAAAWLTMRFSPGYGDVAPSESAKIIEALDAKKKIGLSLTKSGMLVPIKSVVAVIGVSDRPQKRHRSCGSCAAAENCVYRKRGAVCGG